MAPPSCHKFLSHLIEEKQFIYSLTGQEHATWLCTHSAVALALRFRWAQALTHLVWTSIRSKRTLFSGWWSSPCSSLVVTLHRIRFNHPIFFNNFQVTVLCIWLCLSTIYTSPHGDFFLDLSKQHTKRICIQDLARAFFVCVCVRVRVRVRVRLCVSD